MSAKTERITILGTPEFKEYLSLEATQEGISVSELVRNRCLNRVSTDDEKLLLELIAAVNVSTQKAKHSLTQGVKEAEKTLKDLRRAK